VWTKIFYYAQCTGKKLCHVKLCFRKLVDLKYQLIVTDARNERNNSPLTDKSIYRFSLLTKIAK